MCDDDIGRGALPCSIPDPCETHLGGIRDGQLNGFGPEGTTRLAGDAEAKAVSCQPEPPPPSLLALLLRTLHMPATNLTDLCGSAGESLQRLADHGCRDSTTAGWAHGATPY